MTERFRVGPEFDPRWTPRFPELAAVANAVSMAMPSVEPFVIHAVRRAADAVDDETLRTDIARFVSEEGAHHRAHRQFNAHIVPRYPALRLVDRFNTTCCNLLRRLPVHAGTGFAAGFELLGISVAMWLAPRADLLLGSADPDAAALFLWHLGEEVGHRSIAHDVHRGSGGGVVSHVFGLVAAMLVLGLGALLGATVVLFTDGRWYRPVAWWRLTMWAVSFLWASGPMLMASMWRHPDSFPTPTDVTFWLAGSASYDPVVGGTVGVA